MPQYCELKIPYDARNFGMEFEFTRDTTQEALEEAVRYGIPGLPDELIRIADWEHTPPDNVDWVVKRDGSCGWEISTPKSRGLGDMQKVCDVLDACRKVGAKVGPRCGVHIHFQISDFDEEGLGKLIAYWIKMEGMIFFAVPRKRRGNPFCTTLSRAGDIKSRGHYSPGNLVRIAGASRHRALNVRPFLDGCRRIEIRVIEGTLCPDIIRMWTNFFLHFIERVKKSRHPADLKWFGVDEALEWLHWYNSPKARYFYMPDQGMSDLRDWFLKRILKYSSVRAKDGAHFGRAKEFLSYFQEGNG